MPIVEFEGASKNDSGSAMLQTIPFQALEQFDSAAGHLQSTIEVQDSAPV